MKPRPAWVMAAQFIGIGWYIAAAIVVPTLVGVWADGKLGTAPLFLLTGLVLGVVAVFYGIYKMSLVYGSRQSNEDKGRKR